MFSYTQDIYITSRNKKDKDSYEDSHGSLFGGLLTIIWYIIVISYLNVETRTMLSGKYDSYNIYKKPTAPGDKHLFHLANSTFYPWLRMNSLKKFSGPEWELYTGKRLDVEKLKRYISVKVMLRKRQHHGQKPDEYMLDFRACTDKDFLKRGLPKEDIHKNSKAHFNLCPDFESYPKLITIHNPYNKINREDIDIRIFNCDKRDLKDNQTCQPDDKVRKFFQGTYTTVYSLVDHIDLNNHKGKSVKTKNQYHSQLVLDNEKYQENHSELVPITGSNKYNRWNPLENEEEFTGLQVEFVSSYKRDKYKIIHHKHSNDGGKTWNRRTSSWALYGNFIYQSNNIQVFDRNLYTAVNLIQDFGGLFISIVLIFFQIAGDSINSVISTAKMMRATQFMKSTNGERGFVPIKNFTHRQKLKLILSQFVPDKCLCKTDEIFQIFEEGETQVQEQFNMFTIVKTLNKVKATLQTLMEGLTKEDVEVIEQIYQERQMIKLDEGDEEEEEATTKSLYMQFLDGDIKDENNSIDQLPEVLNAIKIAEEREQEHQQHDSSRSSNPLHLMQQRQEFANNVQTVNNSIELSALQSIDADDDPGQINPNPGDNTVTFSISEDVGKGK